MNESRVMTRTDAIELGARVTCCETNCGASRSGSGPSIQKCVVYKEKARAKEVFVPSIYVKEDAKG